MTELSTRIQLKRDTSANWNAVAETFRLLPGELAFETDTGYVKIGIYGEGEMRAKGALWKDTPYINLNDVSSVTGLEDALSTATTNAVEQTENKVIISTDVDIADVEDGKNTGDIAIVKNLIADGKYEYTAYVWNADAESETAGWQAMDGNYDAAHVFFKDNITLAGDYTSVGNVKLTDKTLSAAGKSVKTLMDNIFTKELAGAVQSNPSTSTPTLYAKVNGAGSEVAAAKTYEYGTYLSNVRFAGPTFTKGVYTYGPATNQTTCTWETQGVNIAIETGADSNSGTCETVVIGDCGKDTDNPVLSAYTTNTSFSVKTKGITTADTVEANTNLGNTNTAAGFTKVQFAANANMSFKESDKFTGARNFFWGYRTFAEGDLGTITGEGAERIIDFANSNITSDNIRSGIHAQTSTNWITSFTVPAGSKQIIFAVPHSKMDANHKYIKMNNIALGNYMFPADGRVSEQVIDVEGANGYTAVKYDVWCICPTGEFAADTTYTVSYSSKAIQ